MQNASMLPRALAQLPMEDSNVYATDFGHEVDGAALSKLRSALRDRYGIDSEYLGVPQMAQVLGVGETTIYDYIKLRRFAVPCRMFNKSPRAAVDDFARWMLSGENIVLAKPAITAMPAQRLAPGPIRSDAVEKAIQETARRFGL
jgi:hypothetical protein